jgi:hypothetical protein
LFSKKLSEHAEHFSYPKCSEYSNTLKEKEINTPNKTALFYKLTFKISMLF